MSNQLKISMDLLESAGACSGQLELFKKFLGKRKFIRVTERNAHLAQKFGLNVGWASQAGAGCHASLRVATQNGHIDMH